MLVNVKQHSVATMPVLVGTVWKKSLCRLTHLSAGRSYIKVVQIVLLQSFWFPLLIYQARYHLDSSTNSKNNHLNLSNLFTILCIQKVDILNQHLKQLPVCFTHYCSRLVSAFACCWTGAHIYLTLFDWQTDPSPDRRRLSVIHPAEHPPASLCLSNCPIALWSSCCKMGSGHKTGTGMIARFNRTKMKRWC